MTASPCRPRQKGQTQLAIKDVVMGERRYVLCRNEEEAEKDAAARAAILATLERKLAHGDNALVANNGFRRFLQAPDGSGFTIDPAKVEADARFDGLFVLRTNTKLSALQVVLRYRNLLAVEGAFRTTKSLLAARPIFHKTDAAIRGHVFCTYLALVLRKELIDRLGKRRAKSLEWQRVLDDLTDLSEIEVEQDGRHALLRTAPGPSIEPVCRAVGITLPPVFQELPVAMNPPSPPSLWCLKRAGAANALITLFALNQTAEVGFDCAACALKSRCCPKEPARKIPCSLHESARDIFATASFDKIARVNSSPKSR